MTDRTRRTRRCELDDVRYSMDLSQTVSDPAPQRDYAHPTVRTSGEAAYAQNKPHARL
jgi:hypothetical protein